MSEPRAPRAWKAPRRSGEALVAPPLASVAGLLEGNAGLPTDRVELFGRSLADLSRAARAHMLAEATNYTRQYRDAPASMAGMPPRILLAGHQPELFHPGVWFKNFVLDRLARENSAVAVNLLIDNDTCRAAAIRVPSGSVERPAAELVSFDAASVAVAWEERRIVDLDCFRSFAARAADALRPLVGDPLVRAMWPLAVQAAGCGASLGAAIAQGRHAYEAELGLATLEVPLSCICRGEAFAWFATWLLAEAPRVRAVYNAAVQAYRASNHIRSTAHPVPDLAIEGAFVESPLWVWSRENPRRRHLFVARHSGRLTLADREGWQCDLPSVGDGSPQPTVEQLRRLDHAGVRIRPRALTNTWYARTVLGDLFVHGIGGARYDEVTDRIIAELFGIEPPAFLTATATLRLPIAHEANAAERLRSLAARRRALRFHAERAALHDDPKWRAAVGEKERCIDSFREAARTPWNRDDAHRRHRDMASANAALAPWVAEELQALVAEEAALKEHARGEQLLDSREHPFCLFPRDAIAPALFGLAAR